MCVPATTHIAFTTLTSHSLISNLCAPSISYYIVKEIPYLIVLFPYRWHIKWIFHQADVTFIDCSVDENTSISTLLAKYMNPTKNELSPENNDKLAFYHSASYSRVSVLIKVDVPGSGVAFQELEPLRSLRVNFANKVITEYPVLYVVLKDHLHSYLDYQPQGEGHDDLFSEIEGKEEEQMKDCDADSDKECK